MTNSSIHPDPHPLAGRTVTLNDSTIPGVGPAEGVQPGAEYWIEDYWDRIAGRSWGACDGNPACLGYAMRTSLGALGSGSEPTPLDDEVVYGKDKGGLGHLVHIRELGEPVATERVR